MKIEIMKRLRSRRTKYKGYTLMELLVSIAIFTIISVLMSNIVLNIAKFSLENERREDFLNEIDTVSNSIKNDLRGAAEVGMCSDVPSIYFKSNNSVYTLKPYFVLEKVSFTLNGVARTKLQWTNMNVDSIAKTCASLSNPITIPITSGTVIQISDVTVVRMQDNITASSANNNLLFVRINACDAENSDSTVIFDCHENPYSYQVAISTRVIH